MSRKVYRAPRTQDKVPSYIEVDCLLPTGLLIPIKCRQDITLEALKVTLWNEARNYPLFNVLNEPGRYVFVYVTYSAEQEECLDETKPLSEIPYFKEVFKLVEKKGDKEEKLLNARISNLINKRLGDFDSLRDQEVNDFRASMVDKCRGAIESRGKAAWKEQVKYLYSPDIETPLSGGLVPEVVKKHLNPNGKFCIYVQIALEKKDQVHQFAFSVDPIELADDFLGRVLQKKQKTLGLNTGQNSADYALKVCGVYEYLLGNYPMIQYTYIYKQVCKGQNPFLSLVHHTTVTQGFTPERFSQPVLVKKSDPNIPNARLLWEFTDKYSVRVVKAGNLNIQKDTTVRVIAGIYHGNEPLCASLSTQDKTQIEQDNTKIWSWNENLEFDIETRDIPLGSRLCVVIYEVVEEKGRLLRKKKEEKVPLAWVNIALIDYKYRLRSGEMKLHCWPAANITLEEDLNLIGGVTSNPDTHDVPYLVLKFRDYANVPIVYPPMDKVLETASNEMSNAFNQDLKSQNKVIQKMYQEIVDKDPLHQLFEQDKELLWRLRFKCQEEPHTLPKLLNAIKWSSHKDVAQFISMLQVWDKLTPEQALELLDYVYPDTRVRSFAVTCLKSLNDTELSMYLIQLVQGLKYELYLNCDLTNFLLERAWANQKIGHYLFWHLRAEMDNPEVSLRFGLILEAYCRGCITHMESLQSQVDAVVKLKDASEMLQNIKHVKEKEQKKAAREKMYGFLRDEGCQKALNHLYCTLTPKLRLGLLQVEKCRFFDSKMRPLLLVYENEDNSLRLSQTDPSPFSEIKLIFKCGDDLRQDMLTLQIFNVMDRLWQAEGLDFRMYHYGCLATGSGNGFIEVVQKAETIANIQKILSGSGPKLTWDNRLLHAWLKDKNPDPSHETVSLFFLDHFITTEVFLLQKAEETFCLSCAGSCVATYVLGIGDRHSDNIMVTERGQLCHIDFGHFLGNFKSKFGVRRERVPFVLASDFEIIIAKEHFGFKKFQSLCEKAFLILRKKGALFISLLAIMLSTGIPELRSVEDLNYVRDALHLAGTEKEARDHFLNKMSEARKNAWSTSLNWYIHGLAKDNTK